MTDEGVQGLASTTEPVQKTGEQGATTASGEQVKEPSIAEQVKAAVTAAMGDVLEKNKRELQSAKDKAAAELNSLQRRLRASEEEMNLTARRVHELDPEVAKELELTRYKAKEAVSITLAAEQQQQEAREKFHRDFRETLEQSISGLGVDPKDPRIDWGTDSLETISYFNLQKKVMDSVVKIKKEDEGIKASTLRQTIDKELRDKYGITEANSDTAQTSGGVTGSGIPKSKAKFAEWVAGLNEVDYKKHRKEIDSLIESGAIR